MKLYWYLSALFPCCAGEELTADRALECELIGCVDNMLAQVIYVEYEFSWLVETRNTLIIGPK